MKAPDRYRYRWRWLALVLFTLTLALIISSGVALRNIERQIVRASEQPTDVEAARQGLDGTWHWWIGAQIALFVPFVFGVVWFFRHQKRQIEDLTHAQNELRQTNEISQLIADNMSDLLAILDPEGRRIFNSKSYAQVLGPADRLRSTNSFLDVHPEDRGRIRDAFDRTIQTGKGQRMKYRMLAADGSIAVLESQGSVVRDAEGRVDKVIVVSRDITEQERTLRRLERQNAALATFAHSPQALGADQASVYRTITEMAAKTLDVSRVSLWFFSENFSSLRCADLFSLSNERHSTAPDLTASSYPGYFAALAEGRSIAAHDANADVRTMEFSRDYLVPLGITSMLDAPVRRAGQLVGVICHEHIGLRRDWTPDEEGFASSLADLMALSLEVWEHRQTARALREARDNLEDKVAERTQELAAANDRLKELDRLKSEFLATMSHELRTPLNSILGFTGVLRQGLAGAVNDEQKRQLTMVHDSSKHLLGLINDLLDLSRIESGRMDLHETRFTVGGIVGEVIDQMRPLAEAKSLRLEADLDDPEVEISSDRKKVYQVLLNLVGNAVKFTEKGHVRISTQSNGNQLTVSVTDTGIGIREEQLGNLFQAFRQVDGSARRVYEGTGLGLYLCQQLLKLLGGEIRVESDFGKGSNFTFTVPSDIRLASAA
jgi:PAS domain S-box-containing protein